MCLSPVSITREIAGRKYTQHVPCNKCAECKSREQNEYVQKCVQAAKDLGDVWFITLTHREDNVPLKLDLDGEIEEVNPETGEVLYAPSAYHRSLDREDIKRWKKRVKRAYEYKYGKKLELNYIIVGEYGPQTHRPHYHCEFFGLSKEAARMLQEDWEKHHGFTYFKYIPSIPIDGVNQVERVAKYCAKYCIKLQELEDPLVLEGKVQKPRKIPSKNLGLPSARDFISMQRYYLAQDLYEYDPDHASSDLTAKQLTQVINEIKKRRKNGKLSNYLIKKLYYKKDSFGRLRAPQIQKMVSHSLQMDVQKDYSRQLAEVAADYNMAEDIEAYAKVAKIVREREELRQQQVRKSIISYNMDYLRKSKQ